MRLTRLKLVPVALTLVLVAAWLLSLRTGALTGGFWALRHELIYLTGILAIGFMAAGVVLAARPVQIEGALGGLDKFYRLHKWFGVGGLLLALAHWLLEIIPRWMVGQGWLVRPSRLRASGPAADANLLDSLRGVATELGEIALYILIVLVLLALWKKFPYRWFFKAHRLMAPIFLVLVFHAVVLMDRSYWTAPLGPLMIVLLAAGTVAATTALFRRIGYSRRAAGVITRLVTYPGNAVLDVAVDVGTAWPGHQAGQFVFLKTDDREGAHPFTISSAWHNDGHLLFNIKGLGDYTRKLPDLLRVGQPVTIEGPYGRFDFGGECARQVWIAGGVGITPFIARLQALAQARQERDIDLFYSTGAPDEDFVGQVRDLTEKAGIRFNLLVTPRDGFLTLDRLADLVPDWIEADIWFCGPAAFGRSLYVAMTSRGLPGSQFHQELFEMR
ncbi:ferric reductase domain-containing protein [Sphingomonas sp. MM-1]|uniref:ferredoxin reductase family protein n=1 Tax=Sphingomonas sp. MM-1 TaxID=745310 RepID=UPI0002C04BF9|nr:ferric reductase-like transmembrane domain-containing protein [Sphingomonas sp. MM-1]AGH49457.1 ferric reductase domain-containing protein [Sphingomonas sp. MM-1]